MSPAKMKAVVTCGTPGKVEVREIDVPKPGPTEILVKVFAAATNPTDWKTVKNAPSTGNIVGCDFAGVVEEIGSEVPEGSRKVGERVAGLAHGSAFTNGAFAEYVAAPAALLLPLPDSWTFEQAAQLGIASYTACLCLYHAQGLPTPSSPATSPTDILVWGGSSSVGQFTVQLAHLSGLRVIATASPHNFELVKSLGADLVFSYKDPETPAKIREATGGKLKRAVDCISEGETPEKIAKSMGDEGGEVSIILRYESRRSDVQVKPLLAYHLFGKDIVIPMKLTLDVDQYKFGPKAAQILTDVLANGKLKPGPVKVMPKGLASVSEGLDYLREGKASGEKVIYRISDTPA